MKLELVSQTDTKNEVQPSGLWGHNQELNELLKDAAPELLEQLISAWHSIEYLRTYAPNDIYESISETMNDIEQVVKKATGAGQ